jgi:hypothetical protein
MDSRPPECGRSRVHRYGIDALAGRNTARLASAGELPGANRSVGSMPSVCRSKRSGDGDVPNPFVTIYDRPLG